MRSLRKTLVGGTSLGAALVVVVAGALLYSVLRAGLYSEFDRSLHDEARLLALTIEQEDEGLEIEFEELDMREFAGDQPAAYLHLASGDGAELFSSSPSEARTMTDAHDSADGLEFYSVHFSDGRRARAVAMSFAPRRDKGRESELPTDAQAAATDRQTTVSLGLLTLTLARASESIDGALARLRTSMILVGLVSLVISTAVLSWIVRRSLRPLEHLAAQIETFGEEDLDSRFDSQGSPDEIRPVMDKLNGLLLRLGTAFERERAFSANVAHELRNPVAGLRLKMDVASSQPREPEAYQHTLDECLRITGQMETMVENLLSMSRLEAGLIQVHSAPTPLGELLRQTWQPLEEVAKQRKLRVDWRTEPEILAPTDASLLQIAVRNVLENAVAYAEPGGTIGIRASQTDGRAEILVTNSGSQLSQADAERAFERFWRGDAARSNIGFHCGLGLPLVHKIAQTLGGEVSVKSAPGQDFEIRLTTPAASTEV